MGTHEPGARRGKKSISRQTKVLDAVMRVNQANSQQELLKTVNLVLGAFGFSDWHCSAMDFDDAVYEGYFGGRGGAALTPFRWSNDGASGLGEAAPARLLRAARVLGYADGLTIPIASELGRVASVSLLAQRQLFLTTDDIDLLHLFAVFLHERVGAVNAAAMGTIPAMVSLTGRQREVLVLILQGLRTREIAQRLSRGEDVVKFHLRAATKALGVRSRTEAAVLALWIGALEAPSSQRARERRRAD